LEPWRFSSRAKSQESCTDFCKECRKSFENSLSLERRIFAKCAKELRTCRSPKDGEITHRQGGDRWQKIEKFGSRSFGRFVERKQGSSRSHEERFESRPLDLEEHMAEIHAFQRKNPSKKRGGEHSKSRESK
jgi:hypothetical protein